MKRTVQDLRDKYHQLVGESLYCGIDRADELREAVGPILSCLRQADTILDEAIEQGGAGEASQATTDPKVGEVWQHRENGVRARIIRFYENPKTHATMVSHTEDDRVGPFEIGQFKKYWKRLPSYDQRPVP